MVVKLKPETELRLKALSESTGRPPEELVEDAMSAYLAELSQLQTTLDSRYEDIKSGRVHAIDGKSVFDQLRKTNQQRHQ